MINTIIYIRRNYSDEIIEQFFTSFVNHAESNQYYLNIISEKGIDTNCLPLSSFAGHKIWYCNRLIDGFKDLDKHSNNANNPLIVLSADLYVFQHDCFATMINRLKSSRSNACFCNQLLSNGEYKYGEMFGKDLKLDADYSMGNCAIGEDIPKGNVLDISSCVINDRFLSCLYDVNDNDVIKMSNTMFINSTLFIKNDVVQSKRMINNDKNVFFVPVVGKPSENKIGIKVLKPKSKQKIIEQNRPAIVEKPQVSISIAQPKPNIREEKRVLKHAEIKNNFRQEIKTIDIKKVFIYGYDSIMIDNIKNKLVENKYEVTQIDKRKLDDYNFQDSVFINLTNEVDLSFSISSLDQKCVIIVIDDKENRKHFKDEYNAVIIDLKSGHIASKIITIIDSIKKNKSYFDKLTKNLYASYLNYRNFFFSRTICENQICIDRNTYKPMMDRRLINPFQIAILYNDIDGNYVREIIKRLRKEDNRVKFAIIKHDAHQHNIVGEDVVCYKNDHNLFKKSVCSIILTNNNTREITDRCAMLSLACGCPAIVIGMDDEYEFIRKEVCFILDYNNIGGILHILKTFINDKNKVRGIIEKGLAYISMIIKNK